MDIEEDEKVKAVKKSMKSLPTCIPFPPKVNSNSNSNNINENINNYDYFIRMNDTLTTIAESIHHLPKKQEVVQEKLNIIHKDIQQLNKYFSLKKEEKKEEGERGEKEMEGEEEIKEEKESEKNEESKKNEKSRKEDKDNSNFQKELKEINQNFKEFQQDLDKKQKKKEKEWNEIRSQLQILVEYTIENQKKQDQWIQMVKENSKSQERLYSILELILEKKKMEKK